jgi:hypothetical protein
MSAPQPVSEKRAALRTAKPIEIVLRCSDKSGKSFIEKTRTVDISRTGAKALIGHDVSHGTRLQMAIPHRKRLSWATVARVGNKTGTLQEIGIAIDEQGDFWGVRLPEEMQVLRAARKAPKPAGTDSSLDLVEELLNSAELRQEPPSAAPKAGDGTSDQPAKILQEQVRASIQQSLEQALQQLNEQAEVIMRNLLEVVTQQAGELLRPSAEAAVQQVEAAADSAQEQLKTRLAEHESALATSAVKARRELARRLASAVGED